MLSTWLTERFDLSVPVVCAPMDGVAGGELAAAVSAAGALGMIGCAYRDAASLTADAAAVRETGRPFGIGLLAWVVEKNPDLLEATLALEPALVSVSFGDYAPAIRRVQEAGVVAATQVGTVEDARAAQAVGVDVIVARGLEAGGHGWDAVATLPLLQGVLDAVDTPVLAAGGIGTARGLAAVLAAGAAGAWVGTAFLAARESLGPDTRRQAVIDAAEVDTVYTTVLDIGRGLPWPTGIGGRAVRIPYVDRWHGRADELAAAPEPVDEPIVWAGQGVGLVDKERAAADIVADFVKAEDLLRGATAR